MFSPMYLRTYLRSDSWSTNYSARISALIIMDWNQVENQESKTPGYRVRNLLKNQQRWIPRFLLFLGEI